MSKTTDTSAHDVLQRVEHTYASCRSYRDTGTVTSASNSDGKTCSSTLYFLTAFTRPDRFRFEYNEGQGNLIGYQRYILWTSEGKAYRWWTIDPRVSEVDSLDMAIAGATGVSSKSAHHVPRLLMPGKITGRALTHLESLKLLSPETINGVDCFRIEGNITIGGINTLWIEKSSYLIRKIVERFKNDPVEHITVYQPELNIEIPAISFDSGVKQ